MNPLLHTSFSTPHATFPFGEINVSQIEEAILKGMALEKNEVGMIVNQDAQPTFENTVVALEHTGKVLDRATTLMYNQLSANTSDELEQLAEKVTPLLTQHSADIMQNRALFERVKAVVEAEIKAPHLSSEEAMLLSKTYEGFERSGVTLNAEDREKFTAIRTELSTLTLQFSQNLIKATNDYVLHITRQEDLDGLPEGVVEQARMAADERKLEGWVITLHAPSYVPFMQYATARHHREALYRAYMTRCTGCSPYNNEEICQRMVNLRMRQAQLLGYDSYASYVLAKRMVKAVPTVTDFLERLLEAYLPKAKEEVAEVVAFAKSQQGDDFVVMPWDFSHYAHLFQRAKFDLDSEMLRPYFQLSKVSEGVFGLASRLYGLRFVESSTIPVYHESVKAYEVFEHDGTFLSVLYTDFFPRSSKQNGAWMTSYKEQFIDEQGRDNRPHVSITMNFTPPTATKPSLLTFEEVTTFLHEFGHALHGMLSQSRYQSQSGTNVYWDFVELPSQIMENFAYQPEFLQGFAKHYLTGEAIPTELIERIVAARNYNVAYFCIRQLSFGLLDMAYYTRATAFNANLREFERSVWARLALLPTVDDACMTVQFGHIMSGGYAAGYYSYKWAEVLDADAFEAFLEDGLFSTKVATAFREKILSKGGTKHPQSLYNAFRGRPATIQALLRRDGLIH